MKKTIAILLVLVIGMVGVFAAVDLATAASKSIITVNTQVAGFAYFGLTDVDDANYELVAADVLSGGAFKAKVSPTANFIASSME
ncbi:MAG: hypothetical protein GX836_14360, partial [Spirochaetales bacterium]|nr:hypothetical protein [Spirochaetales bacterium]